MKKSILLFLFVFGFLNLAHSQKDSTILRNVKSWVLTHDGISVDTIAVDTAFYRVNNYNLVNKVYPNAFYLSNKGSAYRSNSLEDQGYVNDFLFISNLNIYLRTPSDIEFYNTTTPYTNLQYYYAPPKRRSEESVSVLHTQNINKNWNAGMNYNLSSSIGRYDASQADYRNFRLFSSYQGEKYSVHGAAIYNKSFNYENGGLVNDSVVIKHENSSLEPENIPVYLRTSQTQIENYRGYLTQSLSIGGGSAEEDTVKRFPLATASYTLDINRYSRVYLIDDDALKYEFYDQYYIDSISTRDSTKYNVVSNLIQLKFNEEANPFFKLGARVYISNSYEYFKMTAPSVYKLVGTSTINRYDQSQSESYSSTLIGGEVFKRTGSNLWWSGGAKIYIQGYKAGEFLINGAFDSKYNLFNKFDAGLYGKGSVELKTPNYFQENFYSNHLKWNESFEKEKVVRIKVGIKIPQLNLKLAAHTNTFQNHIYFNQDGLPIQESDIVQTYGITLSNHLQASVFHSINDAVLQYTSDDKVMALPFFAIYSTNYVQLNYAKVLDIQFGFDLRFNTAYYSPSYMPATGMFATQNIRKTGNFPSVSPFVNAHIKRFNFFLEFSNVNIGFPSYDAFHTVGYALNPASLRFGIQWNFYN